MEHELETPFPLEGHALNLSFFSFFLSKAAPVFPPLPTVLTHT